MNREEFKDELIWRFGIDLTPAGERRLHEMIEALKPVQVKEVVKYRDIEPTGSTVNFDDLAIHAAKIFQVDLKLLFKPCRLREVVQARAYVCRRARELDPATTSLALGRFFNMDHSSILHLMASPKIECQIPPVRKMKLAELRRRVFMTAV